MIKFIGAVLILLCGFFWGCAPLLNMSERMRVLSEYIRILEKMKAELRTDAPAIPQLIRRLDKQFGLFDIIIARMEEEGPMAFYDAWRDCIDRETVLQETERACLYSVGEMLGRYVIDEQLRMLEQAQPVLKEQLTETRKKLREVSRLYIGMGLSLSAMVLIVLA